MAAWVFHSVPTSCQQEGSNALPTPYYEQDGITIYHGDCREILPQLGPVDVVFADPPYGVSKRHRTYASASGPSASWDDEFPLWWQEPSAAKAAVLAFTPGITNLVRCPETISDHHYRWTLAVHVANGMTRGPFGYGNWIPCVVYARDGVSLYQQRNDVERVSIKSGDRPDHPSPKPLAAMTFFLSRLPGDLVLDPFMGSGTTLVASQQEGRRAIGIEIEERYCEVAARRLQQAILSL